ncbi:MAG: valine--tRNA ligase [Chloroflexi bacterium]|nr:valine--tRNA ligase [Chloroflexota bacterium]
MRQVEHSATEIPKAYEPKTVEQRLYRSWIEGGYFTPKIDPSKKPFVIIMPPPNVTGELHLGHALTATLEDIMTRWHRMKGEPTLWLPGADLAGIATQVMVERTLAREGLTRQQMGRERFLERVWEWVRLYGHAIDEQHKRLGVSCDWTRRRFTLDEGPSLAVRTTFANLYNKGLIYRGERIINWCPRCATALSDLEVEHQEEQGHLYHIRYPLKEGTGFVTVATTRPETLLGDTAVAVNPEDARYKHLVGKWVLLPILNRPLRIIGDEAVDPSFGTGALKITPGHDPVDFEVGQRHGLPTITAMNLDGTMNREAGPYEGMDRFECREAILKDLEKEGLLEKLEPYGHAVGHCGRCTVAVEPLVSKQWFVNMESLAGPAMDVVKDGRIKILPERFARVYLNWMENIRDWCISRQLWWGHRIPAWYCLRCSEDAVQVTFAEPFGPEGILGGVYRALKERGLSWEEIEAGASHIFIDLDANPIVSVNPPERCPTCGSTDLFQDPDVLDTWFSSALWPHSTLGWPQDTEDLRYFYPTAVMETGYDILFFWVARMIVMGLENMGEIPFRHVYLHGLIRDAQGAKMSKTRGNVADPIKAVDTYGTDALRFTLTTGNAPGNDMRLSDAKLGASRNFINKVWNASRYVLSAIDETQNPGDWQTPSLEHRHDRWIVSRLNRVTEQVNRFMEEFLFGEAQREVHDFFWDEFCDWYIEMAKLRLRAGQEPSPLPVLVHVLEKSLRLMHPFIPFVTEEVWQSLKARLPQAKDMPDSIVVAHYPAADSDALDEQAEREVGVLTEVVRAIRNVRAEFKIPPSQPLQSLVELSPSAAAVAEEAQSIKSLARTEPLVFLKEGTPRPPADTTVSAILPGATVLIPLAGLVDTSRERARLEQELRGCLENMRNLSQRLSNADFTSKAPEDVIERERERLERLEERRDRIQEFLAQPGTGNSP